MFLIAKIVRGRRLLHELEQQERDEAAAAVEAANSLSQVSRRLAARHRRSSPGLFEDLDEQPSTSTARNRRSKKAIRQKTDTAGSVDSSIDDKDKGMMRRTSSMPSLCEATQNSQLKHYDYESKLNKMQRRALRFTWHRLQTRNGGKRVDNVFEEVFDRLVKILPQIRDMFTTRMFLCAMSRNDIASLRDHARVTVKMIDTVLKNLDVEKSKRTDTAGLQDPRMIGRSHGLLRPYGMTGQYWEKFGEVMIDVVLAQEAIRDLPGAGQAWVILTACLVDQLRAGFDENRTIPPVFPKQSTVLHNATKHLHSSDTPEPEGDLIPVGTVPSLQPDRASSPSLDHHDIPSPSSNGSSDFPQMMRHSQHRHSHSPRISRHPSIRADSIKSSSSNEDKSSPPQLKCPFDGKRHSLRDKPRNPNDHPSIESN